MDHHQYHNHSHNHSHNHYNNSSNKQTTTLYLSDATDLYEMLKEETINNGLNMLNSNDEIVNSGNIFSYIYQFVKKYIVTQSTGFSGYGDNNTMSKVLRSQELNNVTTNN